MMIGGSLLVGSVAGLLLTAFGTAGLVARILGEKQMLRMELTGYAEYEKDVRHRLIPFVWWTSVATSCTSRPTLVPSALTAPQSPHDSQA
jgi:hypothetical protein